jgi:pimeloyl-ACP methyl ester carboxylesterase
LAAVPVGILAAIAIFLALRPLANRLFLIQINNHWPYLCEFARGEATCFDAPIEACAQRVIAAVRANDADEVIVVGHSGGGALAPAVIVRALELDPDIGRKGPPLVLVTLGSIAPGAALHPRAARLRAVFARLAVEPSVLWIDSQSRADVLNFWNFDPVEGIGAQVDGRRCNPLIWKVRFGDMLSRQFYWRIRFNFFRCTISSSWRATGARLTIISCWFAARCRSRLGAGPNGVLAAFAADGSLAAGDLPGAARSATCSA